MQDLKSLYEQYVVPTYGRFNLAFEKGEGSRLWDFDGKEYLDMGCGIAVCSLGHAHPEVAAALADQARKLVHVSNLYYTEPQGLLAKKLVELTGPGKVFFCNSGAEANEGLYKLARRFGNEEGRFEIITATNSFHGRTMAGIAATGQEKVRVGFGPTVPGFTHVPFNDLEAAKNAISPGTAAILVEGIQGEGGITPATPEYLRGLRRLCDEHNLLLMMDAVQCGFFRSGKWQSYQTILGDAAGFEPDAISMAKSLGGGLPIGCFWINEKHAELLGPGSHGTTFGGTPLVCAGALKIIEVIERDSLAENAAKLGAWLQAEVRKLIEQFPKVLCNVRGLGLMIGIELTRDIPAFTGSDSPQSIQMVNRLHDAGLITIPAGASVIRFLPALNLTQADAARAIELLAGVVQELNQ
ncbi:MAG: aspartate aminotransferase family protein [Limisphaerales bacterium]